MERKRIILSLLLVLTVPLPYTLFVTTSYAQQSTEQLALVAYSWPSPLQRCIRLTGAFKNHGTTSINIGGADVFINGASAPLTVGVSILTPGETTTFTIASTAADYVQGITYPLKIVTQPSGLFAFSLKCGGTGTINVTVVNATDDNPLQGVAVWLFTPNLYSPPSYQLLVSGWLVESQTTDSSGQTLFTGLG